MIDKEQLQITAHETTRDLRKAGVAMVMGTGKTKLGLMDMDYRLRDDSRFLVVAPKRSVFESWNEAAQKFGYEHLMEHIDFTTYLSLPKRSQSYDAVYLDECHNLTANHDLWLSTYGGRIYGLTGTKPVDSTSEKFALVDRHCPISFEYEIDQAVSDDILNDYEIYLHGLTLNNKRNHHVKTKSKSWVTSEMSDYLYWTNKIDNLSHGKSLEMTRILRMRALMDYRTKEVYSKQLITSTDDKILVFANTKAQADRLSNYTYYSGNPKSEENLELFKSGDIKCLCGVLQLNEGINIPDLRRGLILHSYSNERKTAQRIGRFLRLNPDEKARIDILYYKGTVDEEWLWRALESFDINKIKHVTNDNRH